MRCGSAHGDEFICPSLVNLRTRRPGRTHGGQSTDLIDCCAEVVRPYTEMDRIPHATMRKGNEGTRDAAVAREPRVGDGRMRNVEIGTLAVSCEFVSCSAAVAGINACSAEIESSIEV